MICESTIRLIIAGVVASSTPAAPSTSSTPVDAVVAATGHDRGLCGVRSATSTLPAPDSCGLFFLTWSPSAGTPSLSVADTHPHVFPVALRGEAGPFLEAVKSSVSTLPSTPDTFFAISGASAPAFQRIGQVLAELGDIADASNMTIVLNAVGNSLDAPIAAMEIPNAGLVTPDDDFRGDLVLSPAPGTIEAAQLVLLAGASAPADLAATLLALRQAHGVPLTHVYISVRAVIVLGGDTSIGLRLLGAHTPLQTLLKRTTTIGVFEVVEPAEAARLASPSSAACGAGNLAARLPRLLADWNPGPDSPRQDPLLWLLAQ